MCCLFILLGALLANPGCVGYVTMIIIKLAGGVTNLRVTLLRVIDITVKMLKVPFYFFKSLVKRVSRFFAPYILNNHTVSFQSTRKRVVTHFDSGTVTLYIRYDQIIINYPILGEIIRLTDQIDT